MKKFNAIFFIVILLVNTGGYRFIMALTEAPRERSLSLLLDDSAGRELRGVTQMSTEPAQSSLDLFQEYNGGYGNAANFNLVAVQLSDTEDHILFKRNLNEYDGRDMRYDMETARSSGEPIYPKPAQVTITPNYLVEFESTPVFITNAPVPIIIEYSTPLDAPLAIFAGATPHQPPEAVI